MQRIQQHFFYFEGAFFKHLPDVHPECLRVDDVLVNDVKKRCELAISPQKCQPTLLRQERYSF